MTWRRADSQAPDANHAIKGVINKAPQVEDGAARVTLFNLRWHEHFDMKRTPATSLAS